MSALLPIILSGTVAPSSGDFFAPVLSAVTATSITDTGTTITWTTDENSDSQVIYGTTSAYVSSTSLDTNLVQSHSVDLSGLSASTPYHYAVKSRDAAGNLATSSDHTFTTDSAPTTDLTDGIVHYWNFNEASGNWADSVGSNTIVEAGTPAHLPGLIGNSLNCNSGTGVGYAAGMDLSGSVTIAGWMMVNSNIAHGLYDFVSQGDAFDNTLDIYILYRDGPNEWEVQLGPDGSSLTSIPAVLDKSGTVWNFVCLRYDAGTTTLRFRVNASSATPDTSSPGIVHYSGSQGMAFGQLVYQGLGYTLPGGNDEIGIWNRSLSDAEVDLLYNSGAGITYPFT